MEKIIGKRCSYCLRKIINDTKRQICYVEFREKQYGFCSSSCFLYFEWCQNYFDYYPEEIDEDDYSSGVEELHKENTSSIGSKS